MMKKGRDVVKVGITGAAGVVGTTLVEGLASKYELKLYDLHAIPSTDLGISAPAIDFSDGEGIRGVFDGLDAVIHLSGDPRPNAPRESTFRNNFVAASHVFEEARRATVGKIVFASSNFYHEQAIGDLLRDRSRPLIRLDDPPSPISYYGRSKVFGEHVGLHLSLHGLRFAALRIGWTVPGDDPRPYDGPYMRAMFCSKRDLVQAFERALEVDVGFVAAYAVSDNAGGAFDLEETRKRLNFQPRDNAEAYF
jgi:NAD+ dependent glucose-6-phosphate dehydrogenase